MESAQIQLNFLELYVHSASEAFYFASEQRGVHYLRSHRPKLLPFNVYPKEKMLLIYLTLQGKGSG